MRTNPWMKLTMDTWSLGLEASSVIGLRALKMAVGGPAAQTEAALMIHEKIASTISMVHHVCGANPIPLRIASRIIATSTEERCEAILSQARY